MKAATEAPIEAKRGILSNSRANVRVVPARTTLEGIELDLCWLGIERRKALGGKY